MSRRNARHKRRCAKKQAFADQKAAYDVVWAMRRRKPNGTTARRLAPYRCSLCGKWHIGNRNGGRL